MPVAIQSIFRACQRFLRQDGGNVLILTGLLFFILVGIGGAGIDLGRQQLVRIKLQQASDAAALAGSLAPDDSLQQTEALRYFNLNFPETYMGVRRPTPTIRTGQSVQVSANATIRTLFVRHLPVGAESINTGGNSVVGSETTTTGQQYDMLLVMDVSGSMGIKDVGSGNSLEADAATKGFARAYCRAAYGRNGNYCTEYGHLGTVGATRMNALRFSANFIANSLLQDTSTDNRIATISWNHAVTRQLPFTSNFSTVNSHLLQMVADGGTDSSNAMAQARNEARNFRNGYVHAVVLLTDGYNEPNPPKTNAQANSQTLAECSSLKSSGAIVYTIAFGNTLNQYPDSKQMLEDCSSDNPDGGKLFFVAPDAQSLSTVFSSILTSVKKIRIVE